MQPRTTFKKILEENNIDIKMIITEGRKELAKPTVRGDFNIADADEGFLNLAQLFILSNQVDVLAKKAQTQVQTRLNDFLAGKHIQENKNKNQINLAILNTLIDKYFSKENNAYYEQVTNYCGNLQKKFNQLLADLKNSTSLSEANRQALTGTILESFHLSQEDIEEKAKEEANKKNENYWEQQASAEEKKKIMAEMMWKLIEAKMSQYQLRQIDYLQKPIELTEPVIIAQPSPEKNLRVILQNKINDFLTEKEKLLPPALWASKQKNNSFSRFSNLFKSQLALMMDQQQAHQEVLNARSYLEAMMKKDDYQHNQNNGLLLNHVLNHLTEEQVSKPLAIVLIKGINEFLNIQAHEPAEQHNEVTNNNSWHTWAANISNYGRMQGKEYQKIIDAMKQQNISRDVNSTRKQPVVKIFTQVPVTIKKSSSANAGDKYDLPLI